MTTDIINILLIATIGTAFIYFVMKEIGAFAETEKPVESFADVSDEVKFAQMRRSIVGAQKSVSTTSVLLGFVPAIAAVALIAGLNVLFAGIGDLVRAAAPYATFAILFVVASAMFKR